MPRKRKPAAAVGIGLSAKQMRRKKPISSDYLVDIVPITENQEKFFGYYKEGNISSHTVLQVQERPL